MVFIGGPRQVGKTTFAQSLLSQPSPTHPAYLNWDHPEMRSQILNQEWPKNESLIVFDELHKYARWRGLIKGYYDVLKNSHSFLVTGSARLDYYRKGGDSLMGRYHYYRMHPLSLGELSYSKDGLEHLLKFGGFPEPFFLKDEKQLRRWQKERLDRVIRDDLVSVEHIKEITLIERLAEALPDRVGSILSIKNLAQDLEIDFKTAKRWIEILENLYFCFRVAPFGTTKIKAVKKEQKLFLWDWSAVQDIGARFENLVASQLLKYYHFLEDTEGCKMELRFIKTIEKKEVDFVVLQQGKPLFAVECKTGEKATSPHLHYFNERLSIPHYYQVHLGKQHRMITDQIEIIPFTEFCKNLNMP